MKIRGITKKSDGQFRVYFYCGKMLVIYHDEAIGSGYSQWADYFGINDWHFEQAAEEGKMINGDEKLINWTLQPPLIQAQIEKVIYMEESDSE